MSALSFSLVSYEVGPAGDGTFGIRKRIQQGLATASSFNVKARGLKKREAINIAKLLRDRGDRVVVVSKSGKVTEV